jgi:hypothetical protein
MSKSEDVLSGKLDACLADSVLKVSAGTIHMWTFFIHITSVADPDPPNPHVFGPPGSGSTSQRYGTGSFYHHAKIVRKTFIPTIL